MLKGTLGLSLLGLSTGYAAYEQEGLDTTSNPSWPIRSHNRQR